MPSAVANALENKATTSQLAGKPAPKEMLVDPALLEREYFERRPDLSDLNQMVSFGARGSSPRATFTEAHHLYLEGHDIECQ